MELIYKNNPWRIPVIIMLFAALILMSGAAISAQSAPVGAPTTNTIPNAGDELKECASMLDQSINEARACDRALKSAEALNAAKNDIILSLRELAAERLKLIESQSKVIERLEKITCSQTSFLFGLVKKKTCY